MTNAHHPEDGVGIQLTSCAKEPCEELAYVAQSEAIDGEGGDAMWVTIRCRLGHVTNQIIQMPSLPGQEAGLPVSKVTDLMHFSAVLLRNGNAA